MKKSAIFAAMLILAPTLGMTSRSQTEFGISISDGKLRAFYFAVGDHYSVPPSRVIALRERHRLGEDELPVVYFLAARARVEPSLLLDLRLGRKSWLDIAFHFGLTPDVFYVPVTAARIGPPYGNAYGYFKKYKPGREWRKIVLTDREIVDLVNLRFMSEYHGIPAEDVMEMRGKGQNFLTINEGIGKEKSEEKKRQGPARQGEVQEKTLISGKRSFRIP